MRYRLLLYILLICGGGGLWSFAAAQDIAITTELTPSTIQIGEYAQIKMAIRTNDLDNTLLVIPQERQMGQAEMIAFEVTDTIPLQGTEVQLNALMTITSFAEGMAELPAFGVTVGGESYFSKPLYLKVTMPEVDTTQPLKYNPIKAPVSVSLRWWEYILLVLMNPITWVVLGIIIVVLLILWYRHYKRTRPEPEVVVVPLTALETFDQRLATLRALPFDQQEEQIAYYDGLITALRSYLTEGLGLEIDELTARELAQLLQKAPYEVSQSALAQWVIHSEWVRFADTWAERVWQAEDATSIYEVVHQLASRKEGKSL